MSGTDARPRALRLRQAVVLGLAALFLAAALAGCSDDAPPETPDAVTGKTPVVRPEDVQVWIASDGPDTARLKKEYAADRRLHWLGRLSDADKTARLRGADVFCAPSLRGESFGVVLIEAMAAGTAIVASGLDGYRNVATNDVDALLVEPGDTERLAQTLRRALGDAQLRGRLVAAGQRRAEDFSMDTLADLYAERYHRLAGRPAV